MRIGIVALITAFVVCAAPTHARASSSQGTDSAAIVNSGSTNTSGFRIMVEQSGEAEHIATPRRVGPQSREPGGTVRRKLPHALVVRFYSDLKAASPLSSLPEPHCMKSVSFGVSLTVEFKGQKTPDLSCGDGGNSALQALIRDVKEIVGLFGAE